MTFRSIGGRKTDRPVRPTRSAIEEHADHLPTPFVGCPICEVRPRMTPLQIGWLAAPAAFPRAA